MSVDDLIRRMETRPSPPSPQEPNKSRTFTATDPDGKEHRKRSFKVRNPKRAVMVFFQHGHNWCAVTVCDRGKAKKDFAKYHHAKAREVSR